MPQRHRKVFFTRFWAGLLIACQLTWPLPARAQSTLRPSVEGSTPGLEETLRAAGMEEGEGDRRMQEVGPRMQEVGPRRGPAIPVQFWAPAVTLAGHARAVSSAAFSPDGSRVVTGSYDRTARVWDAMTGKLLFTLQGHAGAVRSAAFSPDGSRVVTDSYDGTARVWDAMTGKLLFTLQGHAGWVRSAAFSPDGSRVVTGSGDETARVWDVRTGDLLFTLQGHAGGVMSVAFSPDGSRVVTGGGDGTARVWDVGRILTLQSLSREGTSAAEERVRELLAPEIRHLRSGALGKRVQAAQMLHSLDRFIPPELGRLYQRLPTPGSRQAGMGTVYLYRKGTIPLQEAKRRLRSLARWERAACRSRGADHFQALEIHSAIPEDSQRSGNIQGLLEFFMGVEGNLDEAGGTLISTEFEDGGLEWQTLRSHHWRTQAFALDQLEEIADLEGFALYGAIPGGWDDVWLHYNANGPFEGGPLGRLLYLWAARNADLARRAGRVRAFRPKPSERYPTNWEVRDPRSSKLGGQRTEITGMLWVAQRRRRALARAYRDKLLKTLDRGVWARRQLLKDPQDAEARGEWERLTRSVEGFAAEGPELLRSLQGFYDQEIASAGMEEQSMDKILRSLKLTRDLLGEGDGRVMLFSGGALHGGEGAPALGPLLLGLRDSVGPAEWARIRGKVVLHVEDPEEARGFRDAGFEGRIAQKLEDIGPLLKNHHPENVVFYTTGAEDWLLRGQLPAGVYTVPLTAETFLDELARLFEILGYAPATRQELKPLADALLQAA